MRTKFSDLVGLALGAVTTGSIAIATHQPAQALTWTFTNTATASGCIFAGGFDFNGSTFSNVSALLIGGCPETFTSFAASVGSSSTRLTFVDTFPSPTTSLILDLAQALPNTGGTVQFSTYVFSSAAAPFNCVANDGSCGDTHFSSGLLTAQNVPFEPTPGFGLAVLGGLYGCHQLRKTLAARKAAENLDLV